MAAGDAVNGSGVCTVGIVQLCCTADKESNFDQARGLILEAKRQGAGLVFLPECSDFIGENFAQTQSLAETIDGKVCTGYRDLARELELWLSVGSLHLRQSGSSDKRITNTHLVIDSCGSVVGRYDKTHMFDTRAPSGGGAAPAFCESRFTRPGAAVEPPVMTPAGRLGLAICYDLRFAELGLGLRAQGAELIAYPSAFTVPTGQAHWEVLLRARAVETQCWIVAAAQAGAHNPRRHSYGHSVLVDPWGKVTHQLGGQQSGLLIGQIDLQYLRRIRDSMPVMQQRRHDLYPPVSECGVPPRVSIPDSKEFQFGSNAISSWQVFYLSELSYAIVNLRPIRPGHVLVCPRRVAKQLSELTYAERTDMMAVAELIGARLRAEFNTDSCSFTIQDGKLAGQTVAHVHMHVLPRQEGDFQPNDRVYSALEQPEQARPSRSEDEMRAETGRLRSLFYP